MRLKSYLGVRGLVAAGLLLVLISGCGGGSDSSSTATKAGFLRAAKAVCLKGEQERGVLFNQLNEQYAGQKVTPQTREKAIRKLIQPYKREAEQLAELDAPEGEEKEIEAIVSAMEEGASQAEANPNALLASNQPFRKADKLATSYGLTKCKF